MEWQKITGRHGKPGLPPGQYVVLESLFDGWSPRYAYLDEYWFLPSRNSAIYMHDALCWYVRLPDSPEYDKSLVAERVRIEDEQEDA